MESPRRRYGIIAMPAGSGSAARRPVVSGDCVFKNISETFQQARNTIIPVAIENSALEKNSFSRYLPDLFGI
jgi:hypothetical protein